MKTAADYARQALRFAERAMVEPEANAIRLEWLDTYEAGQREARAKDASDRSREAHAYECRPYAEKAARAARTARDGGWLADEWRDISRWSAMHAAWCAGYAAGGV